LRARDAISDAREIKRGFTTEPMAAQALGVEAVYASLFLTLTDTGGVSLNSDAQKAFDRLWTLQNTAGPSRGAWPWFNLGLDPYEMPVSPFYGAALAALAAGSAPAEYRALPAVRQHMAELIAYFAREVRAQPLHNRLMLLWASSKLPDALPESARQSTIDEIWRKQEADGGWTIASLGPWDPQPGAPASPGSNSYATGLVACVLLAVDVRSADPRLARALTWLASHQDRQAGYWEAHSMNKPYEPGSMPAQFMRDAATAFAVLALSESWNETGK
jgi:squalene-hopene/tetraprenyl-beta-curcumene cyclase